MVQPRMQAGPGPQKPMLFHRKYIGCWRAPQTSKACVFQRYSHPPHPLLSPKYPSKSSVKILMARTVSPSHKYFDKVRFWWIFDDLHCLRNGICITDFEVFGCKGPNFAALFSDPAISIKNIYRYRYQYRRITFAVENIALSSSCWSYRLRRIAFFSGYSTFPLKWSIIIDSKKTIGALRAIILYLGVRAIIFKMRSKFPPLFPHVRKDHFSGKVL